MFQIELFCSVPFHKVSRQGTKEKGFCKGFGSERGLLQTHSVERLQNYVCISLTPIQSPLIRLQDSFSEGCTLLHIQDALKEFQELLARNCLRRRFTL